MTSLDRTLTNALGSEMVTEIDEGDLEMLCKIRNDPESKNESIGESDHRDCYLVLEHHKLIWHTHTQILCQHSIYLKTIIESVSGDYSRKKKLIIRLARTPEDELSKTSTNVISLLLHVFYRADGIILLKSLSFGEWIQLLKIMNYLDVQGVNKVIEAEWLNILKAGHFKPRIVDLLVSDGMKVAFKGINHDYAYRTLARCEEWGSPQTLKLLKEMYPSECWMSYVQTSMSYVIHKEANKHPQLYKPPATLLGFFIDHKANCQNCLFLKKEAEATAKAKAKKAEETQVQQHMRILYRTPTYEEEQKAAASPECSECGDKKFLTGTGWLAMCSDCRCVNHASEDEEEEPETVTDMD